MISVIIPYVKDRGYLREAMDSVKAQTYKNWEIIKVKKDQNQSKNVNEGLRRAKGDFIKILHDDDRLPENSLTDLRNAITGYDWVCGDMMYFGDELHCFRPGLIERGQQPNFNVLLNSNHINGGSTLYRRKALEEIGGYDEDLDTGEEYDLHLRLLKYGCSVKYIPVVTHHYRLHRYNKSYFMGPGEKKQRKEFIRTIADRYR